mgnify:CR=1 FL=1
MTFKSSIASLATRLAGYRFDIEEGWPKGSAVFIGAPHTSNWDFAAMLAITWKAGIPVRWLGKSQAFDNPLGFVPRWLGGIPVNRDAPQGMAKALSEELAATSGAVLILAPEGTRKKTDHWKSGFYRIARDAGLPIVPGFIDSTTKTMGLGPALVPSGNVVADMDVLRAFYDVKKGFRPGLESAVRISLEEEGA